MSPVVVSYTSVITNSEYVNPYKTGIYGLI